MIVGERQVFNLMDTNGRRNDVITAMQGYLNILDYVRNDLRLPWSSMPDSLAQFIFYKEAIEMFPDVFKQHRPYDILAEEIDSHPALKAAIENVDSEWLSDHSLEYSDLYRKFDMGAENRARHYTSNLVKLGFADDRRDISPVGEVLLERSTLHKDELENLLPLNNENIIYLRQLLKLRIFDSSKTLYYSPFIMGIYALLRRSRLSENEFLEIVQGNSPYSDIDDIESYIDNYTEGHLFDDYVINIPVEVNTNVRLSREVFFNNFPNRKSTGAVNIYFEYYNRLFVFYHDRVTTRLNELLTYYEDNRQMLNKAFGLGRNIFSQRTGERPDVIDFLDENEEMFSSDINQYLYQKFSISKAWDVIREYSDTTKRIFKASGIISFANGYAELAYHELCEYIFDEDLLKNKILGNIDDELSPYYDCYEEYEDSIYSYYCSDLSVCQIFELEENIEEISEDISVEFDGAPFEEIPHIIADRRRQKFETFISTSYPADRVKEILTLFSNRRNDRQIKAAVSEDATVPTIYEYIVGIAWYYFADKRIDLLSSYNLTLSANFEPLNHAGGGQGDIVIYEENDVTMLEATLMNVSSQKRGEWEPVLRHSVNLKAEEETNETGRRVTTFFIADVFDANTVNIWKAIASVPLQSTIDHETYTDNIVIMPISSMELCQLMDKSDEYDSVIQKVHDLFEVDKVNFDIEWRDKFITEII